MNSVLLSLVGENDPTTSVSNGELVFLKIILQTYILLLANATPVHLIKRKKLLQSIFPSYLQGMIAIKHSEMLC